MSLLMKALEKAAKDRVDARVEAPAVAPAEATPAPVAPAVAKSELTLEPMAAEALSAPRPDAAPRAAVGRAPAPAPAAEQAQAGIMMQAGAVGRPAPVSPMAYVREHPVLISAALAVLIAVGFGIYVYLQIFSPGLFLGQPPLVPKGPAPLAQAPAAPAPRPAAPIEPLPSGPLLREALGEGPRAAPAPPRPRPEAFAPAAREPAPRDAIVVSTGSAAPVLAPQLTQAYTALRAGQVGEARQLYAQLASAEPKNVDALLGLAAVAVQQGDTEEATRRFLQILELEPRHAQAQAGLIALLGRADPVSAESRLKQLIAREPSAQLYFTLGNLYADQSQWGAAQQAYFQAHQLDSANPDYAYNLAVGLDHVSQPRLALNYYRRAVQLAAARGRANFSIPQAQERIDGLAQQVKQPAP